MSLRDALPDARVRFWMCPITAHSERRGVVTVEWDEQGVGHCTEPGCTLTSANTSGTVRMAYEKGRADERESIAQVIEARRNEHWQRHLAEHPYATANSCPADYAKHDAYYDAANIARGDQPAPEANGHRWPCPHFYTGMADYDPQRRCTCQPAPEAATVERLATCDQPHGGEGNAATVYGHHGSVRTCIRLYETDTWVYDPRWEKRP